MMKRDDWDEHWDSMSHTVPEYRAEIRSLRERITLYLKDIDRLETEVSSLMNELRISDREIHELREQIRELRGR